MALFRDFSFGAPSQRSYTHAFAHEDDTYISPTTTSCPPLPQRFPSPPPCSIGDLAQALVQHSLRIDPEMDRKSSAGSSADEASTPTSSYAHVPLLSTQRLNSATLRMQRQANVRMLSSSTHLKDISSLVEDMIKSEDQCHIRDRKSLVPPPSPTTSTSSSEDSSDDMDVIKVELPSAVPCWRSAESVFGCARVSKSVRMRNKARITKRSAR